MEGRYQVGRGPGHPVCCISLIQVGCVFLPMCELVTSGGH